MNEHIEREIVVALAGNPNSGKTTLFNQLTGSNQHVGNWSGVTVERHDGWVEDDSIKYRVTDLPGMYSLSAESPDEEIARDFIIHGRTGEDRPDLIIQVVDGGSLERSLFLTLQLLDQELPLILVLNMYDEVRRRGILIDPDHLSRRLGVPVIPTVANRGEGIQNLISAMKSTLQSQSNSSFLRVEFDPATESALEEIDAVCKQYDIEISRGIGLALLHKDESPLHDVPEELADELKKLVASAVPKVGSSWQDATTHARYKAISTILANTIGFVSEDQVEEQTSRIDNVLIHRIWGLPIFLLVLLALFELTFWLGAIPMAWLDAGFAWSAGAIHNTLPPGLITDLLADGIVSGMGFVAVFLPNILILLTGIHLLEDSGYMARAAFLMDRIMRMMGLHGRAFIPLLMGFGCNVPALLGTRILESRRDRILTMLIIPLMSCSARLPVYVMVTAAIFPRHGGLIIFSLYLLGSLIAVLAGRLFGRTLLKGQSAPFIMELPPYRWPALRTSLNILKTTFIMYCKRIAGVVLIFAVSIWFLSNFPRAAATHADQTPAAVENRTVEAENNGGEPAQTAYGEGTYILTIGHYIEPVFNPLGFTLPMDIALISGFIAKEVVVATMGVMYTGRDDADEKSLINKIRQDIPSRATALAFLVFILLYTPCLTTVVTLHREAGNWTWTAFSILYQTALAYVGALLTKIVAVSIGLG